MVELGEHPRFGQIRLGIFGAGDAFRSGNLDRHAPIEVRVMREIDPAKVPRAQQAKQPIAANNNRIRWKRAGAGGASGSGLVQF